jgi:hypothetical protein
MLFGAPDVFTAGLCVLEPQLSAGTVEGAMVPVNWAAPRVRVAPPTGIDLFEFRLHSPVEANDLVAYTTQPTWYFPTSLWSAFTGHAGGTALTITVRGMNAAAPGVPVGVKGDFNIAPVAVSGSVIFFAENGNLPTPTAELLWGFSPGDQGVGGVLSLPQVTWTGQPGEDGAELRGYYDSPKSAFPDGVVKCTGCHSVLPDGNSLVFTDDWPWCKGAAVVTGSAPGSVPSYLGAGAQAVMKMPWWGSQATSPAHFSAGDRVLITSYATTFKSGMARNKPWQPLPRYDLVNPANDDRVKWHALAWIDLESSYTINVAVTDTPDYGQALTTREMEATAAEGTTYGLIATGDAATSDVMPAMNHRGDTIAYVATDYSPDGHPDYTATMASIRTVAYNNRQGGASRPLDGASDAAHLDYYPSYSADDTLIAFVQAPAPSASAPDGPYYNRFGQVMIVPAGGGIPVRLAANDPIACAGDNVAAGLINSWPRWSPDAVSDNGKTYYFLVFTSARKYGDEFATQFNVPYNPAATFAGLTASSQIWLTAVVVDNATGVITTYPAYYVWNQNRAPGTNGAGAGVQATNLTPTWEAVQLPTLAIQPVAP